MIAKLGSGILQTPPQPTAHRDAITHTYHITSNHHKIKINHEEITKSYALFTLSRNQNAVVVSEVR